MDALIVMFPALQPEILQAVLDANRDDFDQAVDALLVMSSDTCIEPENNQLPPLPKNNLAISNSQLEPFASEDEVT